jgi:hypothetical protein
MSFPVALWADIAWLSECFVDFGQISAANLYCAAQCFGLKPEVSLAPLAVLIVTAPTRAAIS